MKLLIKLFLIINSCLPLCVFSGLSHIFKKYENKNKSQKLIKQQLINYIYNPSIYYTFGQKKKLPDIKDKASKSLLSEPQPPESIHFEILYSLNEEIDPMKKKTLCMDKDDFDIEIINSMIKILKQKNDMIKGFLIKKTDHNDQRIEMIFENGFFTALPRANDLPLADEKSRIIYDTQPYIKELETFARKMQIYQAEMAKYEKNALKKMKNNSLSE